MSKENLPTQSTIAPCSRKLSKISQKKQKKRCKISSLHIEMAEGGLARLPRAASAGLRGLIQAP